MTQISEVIPIARSLFQIFHTRLMSALFVNHLKLLDVSATSRFLLIRRLVNHAAMPSLNFLMRTISNWLWIERTDVKLMEGVLWLTMREAALVRSGSLEDSVAVKATSEEIETLSDLSETLKRQRQCWRTGLAQGVLTNLLLKNK